MNEIWHRFSIGVGVLLWVVVYAPTGPGASFSETPFFTPFFRLWTCKCVCVCVIWVPSFPRARRCFPIFLGRLLGRRARICLSLSFLGWPSIFLFSGGSAQHALGRPLERFSAAGSRVLPCETRAAAEG